jgi:hypothetical protein
MTMWASFDNRFDKIEDRLVKIEADVAELKRDVSDLKAKVAVLQWMMGFILAFQVAILAKLFLH